MARFDIQACSKNCSPFPHVHFCDTELRKRFGPTNSIEEAEAIFKFIARHGEITSEGSADIFRCLREEHKLPDGVPEWHGMRREGWALKALMEAIDIRLHVA